MKKFILFISILFYITFIKAQDNKPFYTGGMLFFQPGYAIAENSFKQIESVGYGLGGLLRFYVKNHLTLGIIGGSHKTHYETHNSKNSYISLGYGGIFFGYTYASSKFRFCTAASFGMGRIKNLHIENQNGSVLDQAYFYSYPAKVVYPMLSFDYYITKKLSFVVQTIFLTSHYNKNDLYFCPILQFGIVFNRN